MAFTYLVSKKATMVRFNLHLSIIHHGVVGIWINMSLWKLQYDM